MAKPGARWSRTPPRPVAWLAAAGRAVGRVLRDPVIGILLLAGVAELLAGDPLVDGLVLLTVAAALTWDRVRRQGAPGAEPPAAPGSRATERLVPALQLSSLRPGSPVPSLGAVLRRVMRTRSGRVGVMVGWAWLGVHFLAR